MPSSRPPTPSQSERLQLEVRILTSELEAATPTPDDSAHDVEDDAPAEPPSVAPHATDAERASD